MKSGILEAGRRIKNQIEERIISAGALVERFENDVIFLMRNLKGGQWDILKNVTYGVISETAASAGAILIYPLGFVEWDEPLERIMRLRAEEGYEKNPVLLVHGYIMNNSNFLIMRRRLKKAGWNYVSMINLKTYAHTVEKMAGELKRKVDNITKITGFKKVDIIAHSLGGLVSRYYVQFMGGAEKVKTLITLGTPHQGTELYFVGHFKSAFQMNPRGDFILKINSENVENLKKIYLYSLWSPFDMAVLPPSYARLPHFDMGVSIRVDFVGHMGLLFNARVFELIRWLLERHTVRRKKDGKESPAGKAEEKVRKA